MLAIGPWPMPSISLSSNSVTRVTPLLGSNLGIVQLHCVILGLLVHMVVVGLPISLSIRRFA